MRIAKLIVAGVAIVANLILCLLCMVAAGRADVRGRPYDFYGSLVVAAISAFSALVVDLLI